MLKFTTTAQVKAGLTATGVMPAEVLDLEPLNPASFPLKPITR